MPVTTTETPDLLRVSFYLAEAGKGVHLKNEAEVVCFLRLTPGVPGFQVLYAYHLIRNRNGNIGAFNREDRKQYPLTDSLMATIQHCVKEEYWSCFSTGVAPLPFEDGGIGEMSDEELEVQAATSR